MTSQTFWTLFLFVFTKIKALIPYKKTKNIHSRKSGNFLSFLVFLKTFEWKKKKENKVWWAASVSCLTLKEIKLYFEMRRSTEDAPQEAREDRLWTDGPQVRGGANGSSDLEGVVAFFPSCPQSGRSGRSLWSGAGPGGRVITCTPRRRCSASARPRTDSCRCPRSPTRWTPWCWTLRDETESYRQDTAQSSQRALRLLLPSLSFFFSLFLRLSMDATSDFSVM